MINSYDKVRAAWNEIFSNEKVVIPKDKSTGKPVLDAYLDRICQPGGLILDFGCGNGTILFYCALRGTKKHVGIDLSKEGVDLANRRAKLMPKGDYEFIEGGVSALSHMAAGSADGVILSNVLDNLTPDDSIEVLEQTHRILRAGGMALVKLNSYLTKTQVEEWNIKTIAGDLLDDGLLLWNQTDDKWTVLFDKYFTIEEHNDLYYEEHDQHNRLFLLKKPIVNAGS